MHPSISALVMGHPFTPMLVAARRASGDETDPSQPPPRLGRLGLGRLFRTRSISDSGYFRLGLFQTQAISDSVSTESQSQAQPALPSQTLDGANDVCNVLKSIFFQ